MMVDNHKLVLPKLLSMRGSTLLEVLISVFIMAFGIMALMLAQLKSVSNVREAEMQTRVAQAVQNMSAGMLSNPDEISGLENLENRISANVKLTYTRYNTNRQSVAPKSTPSTIPTCGAGNNTVNDTALINCHKQAFVAELQNALPNATRIIYSITSTSVAANNPNTTTIQVDWTESNGNNDNFDYSYSAVVGD